ncbi:mevalonate kinase isoform X3 [Octopus bimaculoides]|uniref:Mevalonate kinase n=1 Tax=Octopus bimaculoides TaxID=37653 RepID=A0A0L8ID23_OCTBM|nr:mevalonate kinase isoform X3 [Octopus bimaculoides]|eukprot:XP_014776532.1 PREDICTED: mevalonate kinase-like isoform X2 [Octopus bimaculoides]
MVMNSITVSAPGKLILFGEHAVVYGKMAISSSLNMRSFIRLTPSDTGMVQVSISALEINKTWSLKDLKKLSEEFTVDELAQRPTATVLKRLKSFLDITSDSMTSKQMFMILFLYLYLAICINSSQKELPSIQIAVIAELPVGAGLGSSACIAVCLSAALLQQQQMITHLHKNTLNHHWTLEDLKKIDAWAFRSECIIHGTPSGIDNTICTFGGAVTYENGKIQPLQRNFKLNVLIINTKIQRSTRKLVEGVKQKMARYPEVMQKIMDVIHGISLKACEILNEEIHEDKLYPVLEELVDLNHCQLAALGVSHPSLEYIRYILHEFSLSAKLTGAGGGGCAFAILNSGVSENQKLAALQKLNESGFHAFETILGGQGVKLCTSVDENPFTELTDI